MHVLHSVRITKMLMGRIRERRERKKILRPLLGTGKSYNWLFGCDEQGELFVRTVSCCL